MADDSFTPVSADQALEHLPPQERIRFCANLPTIGEFHPLIATEEGVFVCAHDFSNEGQAGQVMLPREWIARGGEDEPVENFNQRTCAHLTRLARAVFN